MATRLPFLLFFIFGITSCQRVVDYPIAFEPKLIVQSFISPQYDSIIVSLSRNVPVIGTVVQTVPANATVKLQTSGRQIVLPMLPLNGVDVVNLSRRYGIRSTSFSLKAGENYELSATTPDGLTTTATCQIPLDKVPDESIDFQMLEKTKSRIRCVANWKILSNDNYYNTNVVLVLIDRNQQRYQLYSQNIFKKNGEAISNILTTNELIFSNFPFEYLPEKSYLQVGIANVEKNYYDWGVKQILQGRQNSSNLFPEPVLIPNNINNGIGIFAGLNGTYLYKPLN